MDWAKLDLVTVVRSDGSVVVVAPSWLYEWTKTLVALWYRRLRRG